MSKTPRDKHKAEIVVGTQRKRHYYIGHFRHRRVAREVEIRALELYHTDKKAFRELLDFYSERRQDAA